MVLTYRVGAACGMASARARAEYQSGAEVPELAEALADYMQGAMAPAEPGRTAAIPRQDMHPAIAKLLGIDQNRALSLDEMTGLFAGLRTDHEPIPGKRVFKSTEKKTRLAYVDFTFSAPKSFSLALVAAPTNAERAILETAFIRANDALMDHITSEIGIVRTRGQPDRPGHMAVVSYDHHTSRPTVRIPDADGIENTVIMPGPTGEAVTGDMNRHRHNIMPMAVVSDDGKVGSPMLDACAEKIHEWGAIGHAYLSTYLGEHGVRVGVDPEHGLSVLSDVPKWACDLFRHRGDQGEALARRYAAAQGMVWDDLAPDAKRQLVSSAVRISRQPKDGRADYASWHKTMADAGYQHRSVLRPDEPKPVLDQAEQDRVAYEAALPLLQAEWTRNATLPGAVPRIMAARGHIVSGIRSPKDVDRVTAAFRTEGVMQDGVMTPLKWSREPGERYARVSTQLHETLELEAIDLLRRAARDPSATALPLDLVERTVAEFLADNPDIDTSTEHWRQQRVMIDTFTGQGRAAAGVGVAGSGKTTVLKPVITAHHAIGWDSYGVTLAWRQTHALAEAGVGPKGKKRLTPDVELLTDAGIAADRAMALDPFIKRAQKGDVVLTAKTLVVVDEIATLSTKHILDLARLQRDSGFKIIGTGDDKQCQAIEAGNTIQLFRHALGAEQVPEILESIRQKRQEDRDTARLFRDGKALEALHRKEARGLLRIVPGGYTDAIRAGVDEWERRRAANVMREGYTVGMKVPTNAHAHDVGLEVRRRGRVQGSVTGPDYRIDAVDQRRVEYGMDIAIGDVVRLFNRVNARYSDKSGGYFGENGTTARIVGIDMANGLRLQRDDGRVGAVKWTSLVDKDSGRVRLAYGSALTIDARQGATETDSITILPNGSQDINAFKMYPADTRNREDSVIITSQGAEKEEVRDRRALGDPWLAEATPAELHGAIIDNMARNLSRQPVKQLAVDFIRAAAVVHRGAVASGQAAWFRREAAETGPAQAAREASAPGSGTAADAPAAVARLRSRTEPTVAPEPGQGRAASNGAKPAEPRREAPQRRPRRDVPLSDAVADLADALRREGFLLKGAPVLDGKWHRERVEGDKGATRSGRYKAYDDGLPAGFIQNFKARAEGVKWHAQGAAASMTAAEREALAAAKRARAQQAAEDLAAATAKAQSRWSQGRPVRSHPYLTDKGVRPDGEMRVDRRGNLMTAMRDGEGVVRNVQSITPDGTKRFVAGAQVLGTFSMLGRLERGRPVLIAEGRATAMSLREATGLPVAMAYTAGNLGEVSRILAGLSPDSRQVFAADNDHHLTLRDPPLPNVGREKAEAAAKAIGGIVLLPAFGGLELSDKPPTDWNDYAKVFGKDRLRAALSEALAEHGISTVMSKDSQQKKARDEALSAAEREAARQTQTRMAKGKSDPAQQAAARDRQAEEKGRDLER